MVKMKTVLYILAAFLFILATLNVVTGFITLTIYSLLLATFCLLCSIIQND